MAQRNSQQDQDGVTWETAAIKLGQAGLDLRQSSNNPTTLVKLINARFADEANVRRRGGHISQSIRDSSDYPSYSSGGNFVGGPIGGGTWIYGHGQTGSPLNAAAIGDERVPQPGRTLSTFNFGGSDVVWTGDRLLQMRTDGRPASGGSTYWHPADDILTPGDTIPYGHPAFLPSQVDSTPYDTALGGHVQTCLTATQRVVACSGSAVTAWVTSRDNGGLISKSTLGGNVDPVDIRLFQNGSVVSCVWRDFTSHNLYIANWTGAAWSVASTIDTGVLAFEVAPVPGGFHLVYRIAATIWISRYNNGHVSDQPYVHKKSVVVTTTTPNGAVAIAAAPNGRLCVVWATSTPSLAYTLLDAFGVAVSGVGILVATGPWDAGLSVSAHTIKRTQYNYVIHAGSGTTVHVWDTQDVTFYKDVRYNSKLTSRSFVVGNEVFCWLRATNANTNYLIAGSYQPQVSGYADREVANNTFTVVDTAIQALSMVNPDPLDPYKFTWLRPFFTGTPYVHPGNALIGDMNFLPTLSTAHYGKSVYLSGSAVRNWDGVRLGDTGFQNYPVTTPGFKSNNAGITGLTFLQYEYRVYAVRYNAQGERFQSAALTAVAPPDASGNYYTLSIATLPDTNHTDVVFEVYRTVGNGTTFYLEGTVANDLTAASVSFLSNMDDDTLLTKLADPHATGVGNIVELEDWGPLGCTVLATIGDRLWTAGGQVPRGQVQYSKLKEGGGGVGFDDLEELQVVDNEGGEITSVIGYNDAIIAFETSRVYVMGGDGPNNFGVGSFSLPQIVMADGAANHTGTALTQAGVVYWGNNGPRLLQANFQVQNISSPVAPLTTTLTPTGVRVDLSKQEVVWYTNSARGDAVLWNYMGGSRWAQWTGLWITGCSDRAMVTPNGRFLTESETALGDGGKRFEFAGRSGNLRPGDVLGGTTLVRSVGIVGAYNGPHSVRLRVFYNGAPLWTDQWVWKPDTNTWLAAVSTVADLTPAQVDALKPVDHSGTYATHKRTSRQECRFFSVEWSDCGSLTPTFTPHELTLELGSIGGLGRTAVNTFTKQ